MHAPGSSRTVLSMSGEQTPHLDPAIIARMFGDESRGAPHNTRRWTHRGDHDAGLSDRDFGTVVAPATADRTNHPQTYSKPSWNSILTHGRRSNPPSPSSDSCDTAYASASSPTPRTPSQKQSAAPNGEPFDFFALSCDYGICKPRGIYRDVPTASTLSKTSPSSRRPSRKCSRR